MSEMSPTTNWRSFRLQPDDVLFFRDGKPSSLGTDHYLRSLFPPRPSTLYGALRTRRLLDEGVDLGNLEREAWRQSLGDLVGELGEWGGFGSLELRGPWLVRGDEVLLPAPMDLGVFLADGKPGEPRRVDKVARFRLETTARGGWSHALGLWRPCVPDSDGWEELSMKRARKLRSAAGWYLTPAGLQTWVEGGLPEAADFVDHRALWVDEVRTGLGLEDGTRQSKTGLLYTFGFIRLHQDVSLGFEVQGTELAPEGRVRFGGEARTAELSPGPGFPSATPRTPDSADPERDTEPFLVSFATPTLAVGGAWPPGFAPGKVEGELAGRRCRLLGARLQESALVGGWDVAKGVAKPLRRALPAGSVFAFRWLDDEPFPNGASTLRGRNLCDFEHLSRQGFGLVLRGRAQRRTTTRGQ